MKKIVVLGCGYVGRVLARRLVGQERTVRATTTTQAKIDELRALGAEPFLLETDDPASLAAALHDADGVVHLAPPSEDVAGEVERIAAACGDGLQVYLYGSTTGAFGQPVADGEWIDESTPTHDPGDRGRRRFDYERALEGAGLPLRTVRIAGIYGPDRTLSRSLDREGFVLFEGGPPTSRTHVDDLATLLLAMLEPGAPPLAIACDDEPAPTLEVARYTCELLGRPLPPVRSLDEARAQLSPAALEMRLGGRRCRSIVREGLVGALAYPTYREGVRASLRAEGRIR